MELRKLSAFKQWIEVPSRILSITDPLPVATAVEMAVEDIHVSIQQPDIDLQMPSSPSDVGESDDEDDDGKDTCMRVCTSVYQSLFPLPQRYRWSMRMYPYNSRILNCLSVLMLMTVRVMKKAMAVIVPVCMCVHEYVVTLYVIFVVELETSGQSFQPAANIGHDNQRLNDPQGSDSDEDYPQDQYWRVNRLEREEFLQHVRLGIITSCPLHTLYYTTKLHVYSVFAIDALKLYLIFTCRATNSHKMTYLRKKTRECCL